MCEQKGLQEDVDFVNEECDGVDMCGEDQRCREVLVHVEPCK